MKAPSLYTVWNNSKEYISKSAIGIDQFKMDEIIANVFSNGPFYFYIIDFFDMKIKYISGSVKELIGLEPETVTFQNILSKIHPEDMPHVTKSEALLWETIFNKIGRDILKNCKTSYCFRVQTADGSYQLFNHQTIMLTSDEKGNIGKSLNIHTNISHLTQKNNFNVSIIGMFGKPSYLNINLNESKPMPNKTVSAFSKREIEIIRLMSEGLTNIEIADALCIAHNTVKNHRKNILQKANCKNIGDLIAKCITEGLI